MTIRSTYLLSILFMINIFSTNAQEKYIMNLKQMLEFAEQNNYEIRSAEIEKLKSEQLIKDVRGNGLPKIESSLEYKDYLKKATMILPGALTGVPEAPDIVAQFGKKYNLDAGVQASQLLFSLGYIRGVQIAKKASEIKSLQKDKAKIEVIQLLATEYYNLMAIYKNLEIIDNNLKSLEQTRQRTKNLVDGGLALYTDLNRIEVNYASLQSQREQIIAGIDVQTNNLKYIIGLDTQTELLVDTSNISNLFSYQPSNLPIRKKEELNFENLNEIKLINQNIELNKLQIKQARSQVTPTLAAFASHTYQAQRDEFNFTNPDKDWFKVSVVGFNATIPILSGFSNRAKIKTAKLELQNSQILKDQSYSGLEIQYLNALMQYNTCLKNCLVQQKSIELAKDVKNQTELKYNQGLSTLTDLLIAEQELRSAEVNYVKNCISMNQAEVDLLKSQGTLEFHDFK